MALERLTWRKLVGLLRVAGLHARNDGFQKAVRWGRWVRLGLAGGDWLMVMAFMRAAVVIIVVTVRAAVFIVDVAMLAMATATEEAEVKTGVDGALHCDGDDFTIGTAVDAHDVERNLDFGIPFKGLILPSRHDHSNADQAGAYQVFGDGDLHLSGG